MNKKTRLLFEAAKNAKGNHYTWSEKLSGLLRMTQAILTGKYKPNLAVLGISVAALVYALSPLDFIPEIGLGPIGLLDDAIILGFAINKLNNEVEKFLAWENGNQNQTNKNTTLVIKE